MYARSSTVQGNPRAFDDAIGFLRDEVLPAIRKLEGCIGLSTMGDRDSGRCIATSAWASEEAMHASEGGLHPLRQRYAEILGARPEIQEWEIRVLHRRRPTPRTAGCRAVWSRWHPEGADKVLDTFRTAVLPRLEEVPGFCSMSVLVDRETGYAATVEAYESREAMFYGATTAKPVREDFTRRMNGRITDIAEFDLPIAHLHVPETS